MQETYKFNLKDFNSKGVNKTNGKFFLEVIKEWEVDFHKRFSPFMATHLFSNQSTMSLIDRCLDFHENEKSGMDLIDGEIDIDINIKMEEKSQFRTIYAIGSALEGNEDEPLFLVIDEKAMDGLVRLKYIDDDDGEDVDVPITSDIDKKVKV